MTMFSKHEVINNLRSKNQKLEDKIEDIKKMIQTLIDFWRAKKEGDEFYKLKDYYVDAFRSVQENIKKIEEDSE